MTFSRKIINNWWLFQGRSSIINDFFKKDDHKDKSFCELQNTVILNRDDLVSIYECDCCENLLYQFDHSKKKFLVVDWDDLDVTTTNLNITSKELYEDHNEINQMGFQYVRTLSDEEVYSKKKFLGTKYSSQKVVH